MRISDVYVRFYRAFNFDYLRTTHPDYQPDPWDYTHDGLDYPFVRVKMETDITPVVGANESGKSQLLDAIEAALTNKRPGNLDLCRYSILFGVKSDPPPIPEFGIRLNRLSDPEIQILIALLAPNSTTDEQVAAVEALRAPGAHDFRLFRLQGGVNRIYLRASTTHGGSDEEVDLTDGAEFVDAEADDEPSEGEAEVIEEDQAIADDSLVSLDNDETPGVKDDSIAGPAEQGRPGDGHPALYIPFDVEELGELQSWLPRPFRIDAKVPLPDLIALEFLVNPHAEPAIVDARRVIETRSGEVRPEWIAGSEAIKTHADNLDNIWNSTPIQSRGEEKYAARQRELADLLICKVAGVPRSALQQLMDAVQAEDPNSGYVRSKISDINAQLAAGLNFSKYWTQDGQFSLMTTLRGTDLVFTISDRTGQDYEFGERSQGLKYFLSYFVQYLAHEYEQDRTEVLLMDEPDAYLSSQAQQDLLRLFDEFAFGERHPHCQVTYVTHSPFLIDKNHGERVRVLEKGDGDEGTRVVQNVSRNHFEPLRSSIGAFVAETTFIGNCNLIVEGIADQVLLAGISNWVRRYSPSEASVLDLNTLTLVPAGSAGHIPYVAYLARGMDEDKPAVLTLCDADPDGEKARAALLVGFTGIKRLLSEENILTTADMKAEALSLDNPEGAAEIEDLIPLELLRMAATAYARNFKQDEELLGIQDASLKITAGKTSFDAVSKLAKTKLDGFELTKLGLARSLVDLLDHDQVADPTLLDRLQQNFTALFALVNKAQEQVMTSDGDERTRSRIKRLVKQFGRDHPVRTDRLDASRLLDRILRGLDVGTVSEDLFREIERIRLNFDLETSQRDLVDDYEALRKRLLKLSDIERHASQQRDRPSS